MAAATPPHRIAAADDSVAWVQVGGNIDGEAGLDFSGQSVAMSSDGSTIAIGALGNDGSGASAGHVRVLRFDGTAWAQVGLDIDGEAAGDFSGDSVAMSDDGTAVIVGGPGNDDNGNYAGHARVYRFDGSEWVQIGSDIDGEAELNGFGGSVAMSGDGSIVAIGGPGNDDGGENAGHARVYRFDGSEWMQMGDDIDGEAAGDFSGRSVALSSDGTTVIIGAYANQGNGRDSGHARVWRFDGTDWVQVGADIDGEAFYDHFGWSVAMSSDGTSVVIGASEASGNGDVRGRVQVYRFDGTAWVQVGGNLDGKADIDQAGFAVAMSSDGTSVVIGAADNGDFGHVWIYRLEGTDWVQVGGDLDGEGGDQWGHSVAMSDDGTRIVVGAPYNDGNGRLAGRVRVLEIGEPPLVCGDVSGTAGQLAAAGFNVIVGTDAADFLPGTPGNDFILGLDGNDVILAGMGDDVVCAGGHHDVVVGGSGDDQLHAEGGNDKVWGGTQDDLITGGTGKDLLMGGDGADEISGDGAADVIRGGNQDDVLRGGNGKDDIGGDAGNDLLFGDAADDVLRGHSGTDVCDGGDDVGGDQAFSCETLIDIP